MQNKRHFYYTFMDISWKDNKLLFNKINNLFKRDTTILNGLSLFISWLTYLDAIANCDSGIIIGKGVKVI